MAKNWVRLHVESVEVAPDIEDAILFTTVQSVVPGAHGLYYRENGQKKSLSFDQTGRVVAPPTGWHAQNIYIHLAHGHRHGIHFADYSKANEQFEKNISAVQKLIAAAGLTAGFRPTRRKVKSGFEAQPENVHISDESDSANNSQSLPAIDPANQPSSPIVDEKEELRLQIKELKHQLSEAKKRSSSNELDKKEEKLELSKDEKGKIDMLDAIQQEQAELIKSKDEQIADLRKQLDTANHKIHEQQEKDEEINNLHNVIEGLREKLTAGQKEHKDLHVSLVDHQELLKNAKDKLALLENQVAAYNGDIPTTASPRPRSRNTSESLDDGNRSSRALEVKLQTANTSLRSAEAEKQKLQEANWFANEKVAKLEKENGYLKGANEEMRNRLNSCSDANLLAEKERLISQMAEERARLEWRLGELNQWWNDAKWKIGELESGVAHQKYLLDTANHKIQSLNDQLIIALRAPPQAVPSFVSPTYCVKQQMGGMWQLANNSFSMPMMPMVPTAPMAPMAAAVPCMSSDVRRVSIQIDNPDNKEIFILGSFLNWQAALRCDLQLDGKAAIVVDLPRGRHEFRFMTDGKWCTSSHFPTVPNGFGASNNLLVIE